MPSSSSFFFFFVLFEVVSRDFLSFALEQELLLGAEENAEEEEKARTERLRKRHQWNRRHHREQKARRFSSESESLKSLESESESLPAPKLPLPSSKWESFGKNENCVRGYVSAEDGKTCVCNTNWSGEKCNVDPIPSCDRIAHGSCGDVVIKLNQIVEPEPCACVDECVGHDLKTFGLYLHEVLFQELGGYVSTNRDHVCKEQDGTYKLSFIHMHNRTKRLEVRRQSKALARERITKVEDRVLRVSKRWNEQNALWCSPSCERHGKCEWFECVCDPGRFGVECALNEDDLKAARLNAKKRNENNELSISVADLPGDIKRFFQGREHANNGEYRGVHNFFESLIQDVSVLDPSAKSIKNALLVPFFPVDLVGNVGGIEYMIERAIRYVDVKYALLKREHPTLWINAMDRSLCATKDAREHLPPGSIVLSQFGIWRGLKGRELCFYADRDVVVPASLTSEGEGYGIKWDHKYRRFDESIKDGFLLFFNGRTGNIVECIGELLFSNIENCMYFYSQGVRTWMVDYYKNEDRFFLNGDANDPKFPNMMANFPLAPNDDNNKLEQLRLRSKFCLSAGGNGWDQRFFDSIHRGCIPLMTQLNVSHPFDFILDYDQFTVFVPAGTQKLKKIPEILEDTVKSGKYSKMLKNLRVVHEAMAWNATSCRDKNNEFDTFFVNNGAYYHTVWAISTRLKKRMPTKVAKQICKLYYENPHHESAYEILYPEVQEQLRPRCENLKRNRK